MAIPLRLDTGDLRVAYDLLSGDTSLEPGTEVEVPAPPWVGVRVVLASGRIWVEANLTCRDESLCTPLVTMPTRRALHRHPGPIPGPAHGGLPGSRVGRRMAD